MSALGEWLALAVPAGKPLLICALVLGGIGLWLRVSFPERPARHVSRLLGLAALILLGLWLPRLGGWTEQVIFWFLAGVTVLAAGTAVSAPNPVYTALWFALSLLATAGLFLYQGAQFLGVATIVVYAGAIVVTVLFVLMLAQPEGSATYDRVTWAWFSAPWALLVGGVLLGALLLGLTPDRVPAAPPASAPGADVAFDQHHMARLGGELFGRHLVAVEIVGTLLLVALVGAIAIVGQGRTSDRGERSSPRNAGRDSSPNRGAEGAGR
jgi:NADH-quinone oxidoreductase subunit J